MGRKKKAEEKNDSAGSAVQQPLSSGNSSRASTPGLEGSKATGEEKCLSESAEKKKKQNWLKRIFGRGSKAKDGVRRSVSPSEALGSPTKSDEDSVFSDDSRETSPLSALNENSDEEIGVAEHVSRRNVTKQTSSPAMLGFRKRPVTVEVGDDVWAQVKAKQDAMFHDSNLLKVAPGTSSSAKTPPVSRKQVEGNGDATPARAGAVKPLDVSDDEWARVRAAQEKMFDNTADAIVPDDKKKMHSIAKPKKTSGALTALVEEARQKRPSSEIITSAEKVKAALAKKEGLASVKVDKQPEKRTVEKSLSVESDDPIDVDVDTHEFFADIVKHEFFADVEKHEFFADSPDKLDHSASPTMDTSEANQSEHEPASSRNVTDKKQSTPGVRNTIKTDDGTSQVTLRDLVRQQSLKLRKDREKKRHTIASPEFLEEEQELWGSVQSKHQSVLGGLGTQPISDRLDGLEVDIRESSPDDSKVESGGLSAIRVKKSGVMVGMKPSEAQRPSILPDRQGQKSEDGEVKIRIDSGYLSADLSVVPTIQPSLGLSAGHMRRNLSRKNKRRPPSIRVVIPEDQDLFRIPETRARSNSTGDADDNTKPPVKQAAETTTKGLQRAKTLAGRGRKSSAGALKEVLDEQKSPDSADKQPAWLLELEQKRKSKKEAGANTHPLYKTRRSPTSPTREISTASLVAEAAKRKSHQESVVSFKQPATAPKPRPHSMFVATSGGSKEPSWIGKAQKKSSAGTVASPVRSPTSSVIGSAPDWVAKAQKMSKQPEEQAKSSSAAAETGKLKPVRQGSVQDRINSLRKVTSSAAT